MGKPILVTTTNYDPLKNKTVHKYTGDDNISETVPDQSMTIRDLLDRHQRGIITHVNEKTPFYDENVRYPDPRGLDLVDVQEMRKALRQEIEENQLKLADYAKETERREAIKREADRKALAEYIRNTEPSTDGK